MIKAKSWTLIQTNSIINRWIEVDDEKDLSTFVSNAASGVPSHPRVGYKMGSEK
ncbi:protein of unknown function [Paenibacillus alvei]|uniref:Uncharacterized protein n=1 Tax=Paenibacillus alvei TaxID=44250 RepID=A0A383RDF3_PAEAL|nr:protein of unknown function [Paenibacillus alvei]